MPKPEFRIGQCVKVVSIPPLGGMPEETRTLFAKCVGQVLRIDGFGQYGHLELNVMDDGSQAPDSCHHTIWIEPEHVEYEFNPIKMYGDEYPAAITILGVRMPLVGETRWSRRYASEDRKTWSHISRFMDATATVTFEELQDVWPTWDEMERLDFSNACSWLKGQGDFPDILRYIMKHGGAYDRCSIASCVSTHLSGDEGFSLLGDALHSMEMSQTSNIVQGIAYTKHPKAEALLREHLITIWTHPSLWNDDDFENGFASAAIHCIQYLIELGATPREFEDQVKRLSQHPCARNRDSCRRIVSQHYSWLR